MLKRHLSIILYAVILVCIISCNSTADSNKTSVNARVQVNQSKNDQTIKDLITKYNALYLNTYFDESSDLLDGINLFTYEIQKVLNNKEQLFIIEGTLSDIILEDNTYNLHLDGFISIFRDFRLIASVSENQFNLIHKNIEFNSYTNYAVVAKVTNIKTTLYSIRANESSELIYDTHGLLIIYSDLLEIKPIPLVKITK